MTEFCVPCCETWEPITFGVEIWICETHQKAWTIRNRKVEEVDYQWAMVQNKFVMRVL